MATIIVNMNLAQWSHYMSTLGSRFMPAAMRGVRSGALRCVRVMQERTDTAQPASNNGTPGAVDTGAYRAAWTTAMLPNGASVLNKRPYSPVIEGGRRIDMPVGKQGIINIADWAHRKLHIPVEQARSVAYAIAQEIKRRGLRARKVMSGGLGRMIEVVKIEIGSELGKELLRR